MGRARTLGTLLLGAAATLAAQDDSASPPVGTGSDAPVALPSDLDLHPVWDEQGLSLEVRHEFDRTVLRPGLAWQDSLAGVQVEVLDTSALVVNPAPTRLDGDLGLHLAVSRALSGGTGVFSWQQFAQIEGQFADSASLGGSHTRGRVLAGWNRPWGAFRAGGWTGILWERDDPSAGSLSLVPGTAPHRGVLATSVAALEAGWNRVDESHAAELVGHVQRDFGQVGLREESGSVHGRWSATDLAVGAVAAEGTIDAARRRSDVLGQDRDVVAREAGLAWSHPLWGQELSARTAWGDTLALDYTGRVPGQDAWGGSAGGGLAGDLGAGFFHQHDLAWSRGDRQVLDVQGVQGTLEKSQSSREDLVRLADTLGWRTDRLGGVRVQAGWVRSLDQLRHPENPDQGPADRPDQDVSETSVGLALRDSLFGRDDKPLFSWNWLRRDEVYLRSVRSGETRRREGHRLSVDLAYLPAERIRIEAGTVAREQRTMWRFDSTRDEGLMEWQGDAALQEGPATRPNVRVWLEQRLTWSGGLQGADFAVERRTSLWKPGAKVWWYPRAGFSVSPWIERWIETSRTWDGSVLAPDPRQGEWRLALDGEAEHGAGRAHLSLLRVLADPGLDDWRFSGEGRWTW